MRSDKTPHPRNLSEFLLEAKTVTPAQVQEALHHQRERGGRFGEALVEIGGATEVDVCWALSRQLGMPLVDLMPETLDVDLIKSFPEHMLRRFEAVPLFQDETSLSVAFGDPTNLEAITRLETMTGAPVIPSIATPRSVRAVLDRVFRSHARVVEHQSKAETEPGTPSGPTGAARLLEHLERAHERGASEIHFLPAGDAVAVRYRVAGRLIAAGQEPRGAAGDLLARIEALGGPALDVGRLTAAGRVVCPMGSREVTLDVSLLGCEHGIAIRIGIRSQVEARLESLGLPPVDILQLKEVIALTSGLVIVTGPPRSGRTTTLRALAAAVDRDSRLVLGFEGRNQPGTATLHVRLSAARGRERWPEIVAAHNADVVVFDDIFAGDQLAEALASAAADRMVFATTDACNLEAVFDALIRRPGGAALAAERLHAVIGQRPSRASDADSAPEFDCVFLDDVLRDLLRGGASVVELCAVARGTGRSTSPSTSSSIRAADASAPPRAA